MDKDFNPQNIKKVPIFDVEPNDYNPKKKDTPEYQNVLESIKRNGLKQPIFVRTVNGKYIIVDGEQRYTAAIDLGYDEIYIYDLGDISEDEAKALTIWFEVQVPFDKVELAPLVVDLTNSGIDLPYTDKEIISFKKIAGFDIASGEIADTPQPEDGFTTLKLRLTQEQFDVIHSAIEQVSKDQNVSEGRALELIVADGMSGYTQLSEVEND